MIDYDTVVLEEGIEKSLKEVLSQWSSNGKPLEFKDETFWTAETVIDYLNSLKDIYSIPEI